MTSTEDRTRKRECAGIIAGLGLPIRKVARLLETMKSMPDVLDIGLTRHDFRTCIDDRFDGVREIRTLPLAEGGEAVWEFASFAKLFVHTVAERPTFKAVFQDLHRRQPCTPANPWSLVRGEVYPAEHARRPLNPTVQKAHS